MPHGGWMGQESQIHGAMPKQTKAKSSNGSKSRPASRFTSNRAIDGARIPRKGSCLALAALRKQIPALHSKQKTKINKKCDKICSKVKHTPRKSPTG